jgi:hypothetical protein
VQWQFPERFLYEIDDVLLLRSVLYVLDNDGLNPEEVTHRVIDVQQQRSIDFLLRTFRELCWTQQDTNFNYTNNDQVTFAGVKLNTSTEISKISNIASADTCTPVEMSDGWFLCFSKGRMYAYTDSNQPLYVIETGNENLPRNGMTFCSSTSSEKVYGFGGSVQYRSTTDYYNTVYELEVHRYPWTPFDIVTIHWKLVSIIGSVQPPAQIFAPIICYATTMYMVSESKRLYSFSLPNEVRPFGNWTDEADIDVKEPITNMVKKPLYFDIIFAIQAKRYTLDFEDSPLSNITRSNVSNVKATASSPGGEQKCIIKFNGTSLQVGGNMIAVSQENATYVDIFMEEWLNIDPMTGADVYQRFENTIRFKNEQTQHAVNLNDLSTMNDIEKLETLNLVERIYMHQGRWALNTMVFSKEHLANSLWPNNNYVRHLDKFTSTFTDEFNTAFDNLKLNYFDSNPIVAETSLFRIVWEGSFPNRVLVISGNYIDNYKQKFYIDDQVFELSTMGWTASKFNLQLTSGTGIIEWYELAGVRSFVITLPLEKWVYKEPSEDFRYRGQTGRDALFHMMVTKKQMFLFDMQKQTADFLAFSSAHCSSTASRQCPGLLPYTNLPCSGHGRCGITCQCVCEVAPSVLQKNSDALISPKWQDSPYRGDGCQLTCPGYDGYYLNSTCSGRGVCQHDGKCNCPETHTGDACQFECPTDDQNKECSLNGGCGTKAIEATTFKFTGDDYLDGVTAINKKSFSSTLDMFYSSCKENNYVQQNGEFGNNIFLLFESVGDDLFNSNFNLAIAKCESINYKKRRNTPLIRDKEFQNYPYGMCIGISQENTKFYPALLRQPVWKSDEVLEAIPIFKCFSSDCSLIEALDNEAGIVGLEATLDSPSFEFILKYVHGGSSGRAHYLVNGVNFFIETVWDLTNLKLTLSSSQTVKYRDAQSKEERVETDTVINFPGEIIMLTIRIENDLMFIKEYESYSPKPSNGVSWLAPLYESNYRKILDENPIYTFEGDIPIRQFNTSEYICDLEPNCKGIIQWNVPFRGNWFTMYSDVPNIQGFDSFSVTGTFTTYKKMSFVYQGKLSADSICDVIRPGMSKYPSVPYSEVYDIQIDNIDLSLTTDETTSSIIIGNGLWENCWQRERAVTTKLGCKRKAEEKSCFGFAFSDDEQVCIVYHKMKDASKIKLGRYNSESRLTLFNPCGPNTKWKSM